MALPVLSILRVAPPLRSLSRNQCRPRIPSLPYTAILPDLGCACIQTQCNITYPQHLYVYCARSCICLAHCLAGDSGQDVAMTRSRAAHKIQSDQANELQYLLYTVVCHVRRVSIWSKHAHYPTASVQDTYTSYKLCAASTYNVMFLLKHADGQVADGTYRHAV